MHTLKVTECLGDTAQRKQEYHKATAEMGFGWFGVRSIHVTSFHLIFSKQTSFLGRKVKITFIKPVNIVLCFMPPNATYTSALCSLICSV